MNALLCTLDVRQIRRGLLGKREASGMESNREIVGAGIPDDQSKRKKREVRGS
jgi:hypothetical protein